VDQRIREWDEIAALDPEWSILSDPGRRHGRWPTADFFETGSQEVEVVLAKASAWGVPAARGTALDFGCGVGRISRAMAAHFRSVSGLDASAVMVKRARELNPGIDGLSFDVLGSEGTKPYPDGAYDLVYCVLVLQHVTDRDLKSRIVGDLVRVLARGGLLILQVPSVVPIRRRLQIRPRLYAGLRRVGLSGRRLYERFHLHPIRMSALHEKVVTRIIEQHGGSIMEVERSRIGEPPIEDRIYWVTKSR
jgi:SAM-dependent methyltransferase